MASNTINSKSKQISIRIPHEVIEEMELVKEFDETSGSFITTAMQNEIARRLLKESREDKLLSNLDEALTALTKIEELGARVGADIHAIVDIAHVELERRQRKKAKESPED